MNKLPYVLSEDIGTTLQSWANEKNLKLPETAILRETSVALRNLLEEIGLAPVLIQEEKLISGFEERIKNEVNNTILSLEEFYLPKEVAHLATTRLVKIQDGLWKDCGLASRTSIPIKEQIKHLKKKLPPEITLVDDVIFSGEGALRIIFLLNEFDIRVKKVIAGVGIGEGVEKLSKAGISVDPIFFFENVQDEICQRDFLPGVPGSGRTNDPVKNIGVPYLLPFGDANAWASIPKEKEVYFSKECITLTQNLYKEIEEVNKRRLLLKDIPRKIFGQEVESQEMSLTEYLEESKGRLKRDIFTLFL